MRTSSLRKAFIGGTTLALVAGIASNVASAAEITMNDVVGYWRFEGTNGTKITTATSEMNNDDLKATGKENAYYSDLVVAPSIYDPISQTTYANTGSLWSKSGARGYVETASSTWFDGDSFTIEAFVRVADVNDDAATSFPSTPAYVRAAAEWQLDLNNNGSFRTRFRSDTNNNQVASITDKSLSDGLWHHVALVYDKDNAEITLYVDDESVTKTVTGALTTTGTYLRIGDDNNDATDNDYNWYVDEVRYTDAVLSSGQFLQAVPEPSTLALGVMGLAAFGLSRRARRRGEA